jgi:hypothetical protein
MALSQAMMDVLLHERQEAEWLTVVVAAAVASMRQSNAGLVKEGTAPLAKHNDDVQWHTFAGGAITDSLQRAWNRNQARLHSRTQREVGPN